MRHTAMGVVLRLLVTVVGITLGAVAGFAAGAALYQATGPPWRQFGYEFEGAGHALVGALIGAVAVGILANRIAARFARRTPPPT